MLSILEFTKIEFLGSAADDLCDAWVLEQMGLAKLGLSQYEWPKIQMSALDKVDWNPLLQILDKKVVSNGS